MERKLVCIVCPMGCELIVQMENGSVREITGNTCPWGKEYGQNECTDPRRIVTTTVRCTDGDVVAVKTDCPIPKDKMFECIQILNRTVAELPVSVSDVILEDVFGSRIVATQNKSAWKQKMTGSVEGGNNGFSRIAAGPFL